MCIVDTPDRPLRSSEHVQATEEGCMRSDEGSGGLARRARGRRGGRRQAKFRPVPAEGNTFQDALDDSSTSKRSAGSASTCATTPEPTSPAPDAGKPSGKSNGPESVPRSLPELMKRVIHAVKSSGTRLAVYLRGWDSLHPWACSSVDEPPACKPCISAANKRGTREVPPPRLGLFPCMPMPEMGDSLQDRYVNFISVNK